jgi:hypothetical protein
MWNIALIMCAISCVGIATTKYCHINRVGTRLYSTSLRCHTCESDPHAGSAEKKVLGFSYGRSLDYDGGYEEINQVWSTVPAVSSSVSDEMFERISYMSLDCDIGPECLYRGSFRIYRFDLADDYALLVRASSRPSVMKEVEIEAKKNNIKISNSGGIHSLPTIFHKTNKMCTFTRTAEIVEECVQRCEEHDARISGGCSVRLMQSMRNSEAWLNINSHGHWNEMHHHGGSTWSGVLYLQTSIDNDVMNGGGKLLCKPASHPDERNPVRFTIDEMSRLSLQKYKRERSEEERVRDRDKKERNVCKYISINPRAGSIYCFPSWLLHGVTVLDVENNYRDQYQGKRVSLAFNVETQAQVQSR